MAASMCAAHCRPALRETYAKLGLVCIGQQTLHQMLGFALQLSEIDRRQNDVEQYEYGQDYCMRCVTQYFMPSTISLI